MYPFDPSSPVSADFRDSVSARILSFLDDEKRVIDAIGAELSPFSMPLVITPQAASDCARPSAIGVMQLRRTNPLNPPACYRRRRASSFCTCPPWSTTTSWTTPTPDVDCLRCTVISRRPMALPTETDPLSNSDLTSRSCSATCYSCGRRRCSRPPQSKLTGWRPPPAA